MEREKINKVLELTKYQAQLNDFGDIMFYNNPDFVTISNNKGLCKRFDGRLFERLQKLLSEEQELLDKEFDEL